VRARAACVAGSQSKKNDIHTVSTTLSLPVECLKEKISSMTPDIDAIMSECKWTVGYIADAFTSKMTGLNHINEMVDRVVQAFSKFF